MMPITTGSLPKAIQPSGKPTKKSVKKGGKKCQSS